MVKILDRAARAIFGVDRTMARQVMELADDRSKMAVEKTRIDDLGRWYGKYNPDTLTVETYLKMARDPDIQFGLQFLLCPLYQVQPFVRKSSGDPEIDALVMEVLRRNWFSLTRSSFYWSIVLGYATHEQLWEQQKVHLTFNDEDGSPVERDRDAWVITKYKDLPQETWQTRIINPNGHFQGFYWGEYDDEMVPPEKAFIHSRNAFGQNMFGESRLKAAYVPWWMYGAVQQLRRSHAEVRAGGVLAVWYPPSPFTSEGQLRQSSSEDPKYSDALDIAENFRSNKYMVLPNTRDEVKGEREWDIDFFSDRGAGADIFKRYEDDLAVRKWRGMGIAERAISDTGQTSGWGSTATESRKGFLLLTLQAESEWFAHSVNRHSIPDIVRVNAGADAPSPRIGIEGLDESKIRFAQDILGKIIDKKGEIVSEGRRIALEQLFELFDVPLEDIPEELRDTLEKLQAETLRESTPSPPAIQEAAQQPVETSVQLADEARRLEQMKRVWFGKLAELEQQFLADSRGVIEKVESRVIRQVERNLDGQKVEDYRKIRDVSVKLKDGPYEKVVKEYLMAAYRLGVDSAREELNVTEPLSTLEKDTQWLIDRADAIAEEHEQRIRTTTKRAVIDGSYANMTIRDILFRITDRLARFKDSDLVMTGNTEGMAAFRAGRNRVARERMP